MIASIVSNIGKVVPRPRPARRQLGICVLASLLAYGIEADAESFRLQSPNNEVTAVVAAGGTEGLALQLHYKGEIVIEHFRLGVTVDGIKLGSSVDSVGHSSFEERRQRYPTRGVHAQATGHYKDTTVMVERIGNGSMESMRWQFDLRCYNDGVAFRYRIPGNGSRTVSGETTNWTLPNGTRLWHQHDTHNYEGLWHEDPIRSVHGDFGMPVTAELPEDIYAVISEADIYGYSGMTLTSATDSRTIQSSFLDDEEWSVNGGSFSPWRFVIIADSLNRLVNSDLMTNLCPPPDKELFPRGIHADWIRPGRAVWRWWSRGRGSPKEEQHYITYAGRLGFEYSLIDAGWDQDWPKPWQTLQELVDEASQYGARLWVWKEWTSLKDAKDRRRFFKRLSKMGVAGVKIDYMDSESQARLRFYESVLKDAARHRLMVNFHGANKPAGGRRTYPNELTREAVRGLEYNKFDGPLLPSHNAALPFTRFIVGPADYHGVTFQVDRLGPTTLTHQLATAIVYTSPVVHFAEHPPNLFNHPKALDIVKVIPATWDRTQVLPMSEIGEIAAFARRKGDQWFLALLNGNTASGAQFPDLQLDFLNKEKQYKALLLSDKQKTEFRRAERSGLKHTERLDVRLLPGGGFVGWFRPNG